MRPPPAVSAESLRKAEALCQRMKVKVAEVIERHRPTRTDLSFDEIEANSAAVGDLVARMLMLEALKEQGPPAQSEVRQAREQALAAAPPAAVKLKAAELHMTRIPDKAAELCTARGPVPYAREYLYFPQLGAGVFPPRPTSEHTSQ